MEISRRKFFFSMATAAVAAAVNPGQLLSPFEKKLWVPHPAPLIQQIIGVAVNAAKPGEMLGISLSGNVVSMTFTPEDAKGFYTKVMAGADIMPGQLLGIGHCGRVIPVLAHGS